MKTLVICGDYWHPPQVVREGLDALKTAEFNFDWIENAHEWSPKRMAAYPLVILTKSNNISSTDQTGWMSDSVQAAFVDHVRKGNGLLALHSGIAEYEQKPELRRLLGGVFIHHPDQCSVTIEPKAAHPLSAGSRPFTRTDEHYFVEIDDPQVDVFMTTRSIHGKQPGGWRREEGAGRVVVLTPGHNLSVWLHPAFQNLLLNALRWCSKGT
jgi:type 1 glutamine amidotransferase